MRCHILEEDRRVWGSFVFRASYVQPLTLNVEIAEVAVLQEKGLDILQPVHPSLTAICVGWLLGDELQSVVKSCVVFYQESNNGATIILSVFAIFFVGI